MAVTLLGIYWIGFALAHAVLLRGLPHGLGIVIDVLVGTFLGDTGAYLGGRMFGKRPLAPRISPNKTVEGLVIGMVCAVLGVWIAGRYQEWLPGTHALVLGLGVALVAPVGDLFESFVKREADTKDTGRAVRRARRRARPARRGAVRGRRRLLHLGRVSSGSRGFHLGSQLPKRLLILGSTGSIGTQALDVLRRSEDLELIGLSAERSWEALVEQARAHGVEADRARRRGRRRARRGGVDRRGGAERAGGARAARASSPARSSC